MKRRSSLHLILKCALAAAFFPLPAILHAQASAALWAIDSGASIPAQAKAPGIVRIGIVLPANHLSGKGELQDGEPLRAAELQILHGPGIEAISLQSILPEQAQREAQLQDCDFVLTSTVTQQTPDKPGRFHRLTGTQMLRMATSAAQFVPAVSSAALLSNVVMSSAVSQATALALTNSTRPVRADSDVTLSYQVTRRDGTVLLAREDKTHTTVDGENVLTPMLTAMSAKVLVAIKP